MNTNSQYRYLVTIRHITENGDVGMTEPVAWKPGFLGAFATAVQIAVAGDALVDVTPYCHGKAVTEAVLSLEGHKAEEFMTWADRFLGDSEYYDDWLKEHGLHKEAAEEAGCC